jgi:hypothetical protein
MIEFDPFLLILRRPRGQGDELVQRRIRVPEDIAYMQQPHATDWRADPFRSIGTGVFQSASALFENEGSKHELSKRLGSWNGLRVSPIVSWGGTWKSTNSGQTRILLASPLSSPSLSARGSRLCFIRVIDR